MADTRNWLQTLWPVSFKGMPFFVEKDEEGGGRRIVVHQFPMRDDPFLEDLGEDKREFEVTGYLASDDADTDAGQLVATCVSRGAGILVLPAHGQLFVRCLSFTRSRDKDKHGYIAFTLKFVREGASSALITTASLANLIFIAADALALATAASFVANVQVRGIPQHRFSATIAASSTVSRGSADFVVAAATEGVRDAVSVLEAIRSSEPVEPVANSAQRDEIHAIFDLTPALLSDSALAPTLPARTIAVARALGDAMPPDTALRAFDGVVTDASFAIVMMAPIYPTKNRRAAAVNAAATKRLLRLAALAAYCEAIARVKLSDRPSAITLRANVAEYIEAEMNDLPASEIDLFHALAAMRDATIDYLSRAIIDLAPVITIEANLSMPSLYFAWRLYQDPSRAAELVDRNLVRHPSFMPRSFEALAR